MPIKLQDTTMPRIIGDFTFNLNNTQGNRDMFNHLTKLADRSGYQTHAFKSRNKTYTVVEVGDGVRGYFFAQDDGVLVYVMQFARRYRKYLGGYAYTQLAVWRNDDLRFNVLNGVSAFVFNLLLDRTGLVCSDTEQTAAGRMFWIRRISDAMDNDQYVYLWEKNGGAHGGNKLTQYTPATARYCAENGWSRKRDGWQRVFVIAANPIHPPASMENQNAE